MSFRPYSKEKQTGKQKLPQERMTKKQAVEKARLELSKATIAYKNSTTSYHTRNKDFRKKKKYGNKTKVYAGRNYDSILEANQAEELDYLKKLGEVKEWIPQYKISLDVNGKHIANYYCDFKVIMKDGSVQFRETKGWATDTWKLKWKLMEALLSEIEPGAQMIVIK